MTCWDRLLKPQPIVGVSEYDKALNALRQSLISQRALAPDVLSILLKRDVYGNRVRTRFAQNNHDIEVETEGRWRVLRPEEVFGGPIPLALPSREEVADVLRQGRKEPFQQPDRQVLRLLLDRDLGRRPGNALGG